jgi:hypothetical protein
MVWVPLRNLCYTSTAVRDSTESKENVFHTPCNSGKHKLLTDKTKFREHSQKDLTMFGNISKGLWLTLIAIVFAFFGSSVAIGQGTSATLNGSVLDSTGALIPGVRLTIQNTGTGLKETVNTNDNGLYSIQPLPPGSYSLTAEKIGFQKQVQAGITLTVGQAATVNITLQTGASDQTITVTSGAELINTTTADISQVVNENEVKELPLNGRDPSSLVLLSPGVTNVLNSSAGTLQASNALPDETGASANGGRQGSTFYLLDGVPNMDHYLLLAAPSPNADATQEFRITTNNFDAKYGFSPGAVVNIQTKSGTNTLHGGIFEFLRNNDLNAANFFTHLVDPLKRNQFGGFIGGPILKNHLFFFANYQATRAVTSSATNTTFTPTQAMLNGDFSAVPVTLGTPFGTVDGKPNQINPALFSPGAVNLAKVLPLGQIAATGQTNYIGAPANYTYDEGTGRLDYDISNAQRLSLRSFIQFYKQPGFSVNGNILATSQNNIGKLYNEVLTHTWTINPTLVNSISGSWMRLEFVDTATPKDASGNAVCLSKYINVSDPPNICSMEGLSVSNGFNGGYFEPNTSTRTTYAITDLATKILGNHTLEAGVNAYHQYSRETSAYPAIPIVSFNGGYTGFGLADYLLGDVASYYQGAGEVEQVTGWELGLFAQDQFRLRSNLTITAGLRWEPTLAPSLPSGRGVEFVPGQQSTRYPNAPTGLLFPGDADANSGLIPSDYKVFEPRVGVVWQPKSLPHTSVRAAFGTFTTPIQYSSFNHSADVSPFSPTFTLNGSPSSPIPFDNPWANFTSTGGKSPFPPFAKSSVSPPSTSTFTSPTSVGAAFVPDFKLGVTQSWNLSVDQSLTSDLALHIGYVGSESYHQQTPIDQNPGIYAAGGARATYPAFGNVLVSSIGGTASYQALQVGVEKRFSHSFQVQSNFTWQHAIDTASAGSFAFVGGIGDPFDLHHERGNSALDVRLISVTNFVYVMPTLEHRNGFARTLLGSWEASGIWTFQGGLPFSIQGGNGDNNSLALQYGDRADVTGQPFGVHQGGRSNWLNHYVSASAFKTNAAGTFGNSARNLIFGPGINTADLGIDKNFHLRERYVAQFRWEMFNAFNHANFGTPNTDPTSANFGQITSIGPIAPRVMQGAIKLSF